MEGRCPLRRAMFCLVPGHQPDIQHANEDEAEQRENFHLSLPGISNAGSMPVWVGRHVQFLNLQFWKSDCGGAQ